MFVDRELPKPLRPGVEMPGSPRKDAQQQQHT
jgi:hypothetical protein